MTKHILYGIAFLLCLLIQASFISSLPAPFNTTPFLFLTGVLIMHRSETSIGITWFILSALLLPILSPGPGTFLAFTFAAIAGTLLTARVFTKRSVYALFGLGLSLYAIYGLTKITFTTSFNSVIYGFFFVILGLYLGFLISRVGGSYAKQLFIIRSSS